MVFKNTSKGILVLLTLTILTSGVSAFVPQSIKDILARGFFANLENMASNYIFETGCLIALVLYVVNYFIGKKANEKIARLWVDSNREFFEKQFSVVGINEEGLDAPFKMLDRERNNFFKFFASGRVNTPYTIISIETQKRHDLISMIFLNLVWPEKDRISFDVPLDCEGNSPLLCFAILRKRLISSTLESYDDLKLLCKKYKVDGVPDKLAVYSDQKEFFKHFFDKWTKDFLKKNWKYLESVQISDRQTFLRTPFALRVTFLLPKTKDFELTQEFSTFVFRTVDKISSYKTVGKLRVKLSNMRNKYEAQRESNKEKKKENDERIKKEKEEKWAKMTPKERKKAQELENKRMKNRGRKKMKVN